MKAILLFFVSISIATACQDTVKLKIPASKAITTVDTDGNVVVVIDPVKFQPYCKEDLDSEGCADVTIPPSWRAAYCVAGPHAGQMVVANIYDERVEHVCVK